MQIQNVNVKLKEMWTIKAINLREYLDHRVLVYTIIWNYLVSLMIVPRKYEKASSEPRLENQNLA